MCRWLVAGMSCTTRPRWARDVVVVTVAVEAVAAVMVWRRWRFADRAQVRSRRRPDLMCVYDAFPLRDGAERSAICPPPDLTDPVAAAAGRVVGFDDIHHRRTCTFSKHSRDFLFIYVYFFFQTCRQRTEDRAPS